MILFLFPVIITFWYILVLQVNGHISGTADIYQERLARLENDKESLVLQVPRFEIIQYVFCVPVTVHGKMAAGKPSCLPFQELKLHTSPLCALVSFFQLWNVGSWGIGWNLLCLLWLDHPGHQPPSPMELAIDSWQSTMVVRFSYRLRVPPSTALLS